MLTPTSLSAGKCTFQRGLRQPRDAICISQATAAGRTCILWLCPGVRCPAAENPGGQGRAPPPLLAVSRLQPRCPDHPYRPQHRCPEHACVLPRRCALSAAAESASQASAHTAVASALSGFPGVAWDRGWGLDSGPHQGGTFWPLTEQQPV